MRRLLFVCAMLGLLSHSTADATINVLVSTHEGLVIAADSRLTLSEADKHRIASDSYQKIFKVGKFVGVSCSGVAFLYDENGDRMNVWSIIQSYKNAEGLADTSIVSPGEVTEGLSHFVGLVYQRQPINIKEGLLTLLVFGYDQNKNREIFELKFPKVERYANDSLSVHGVLNEIYASGVTGSVVEGESNVYGRLIKGYDPELVNMKCYEQDKEKILDLRYEIRYDIMSLQDAIDFSVFIVRATIEAQRFNQKAVMGVGGDIDIAVVTPDGFQWIQRKRLRGEAKVGDVQSYR